MELSNIKITKHALYAFRNDINALQANKFDEVRDLCNYLAIIVFDVDDVNVKGMASTISDGTIYISLTKKQMAELILNNWLFFVEVLPKKVWKAYEAQYKQLASGK